MLYTTKYSALCVLGIEFFYVLCIGYGLLFLSGKAMELHHSLFELLPGFVWGNVRSMALGALYLGVFAGIAGWYIAWMHNSSLVAGKK
ncbi:MAG TPA: hypothetical protein VIH18_35100 [Candidatus Binatia bacterium]